MSVQNRIGQVLPGLLKSAFPPRFIVFLTRKDVRRRETIHCIGVFVGNTVKKPCRCGLYLIVFITQTLPMAAVYTIAHFQQCACQDLFSPPYTSTMSDLPFAPVLFLSPVQLLGIRLQLRLHWDCGIEHIVGQPFGFFIRGRL